MSRSLLAAPLVLLPLLAASAGCALSAPRTPAIRVGEPPDLARDDDHRTARAARDDERTSSDGPRHAPPRPAPDDGGGGDYGGGDDDGWGFLDFLWDVSYEGHVHGGGGGPFDMDRYGLVVGVHRLPAIGLRPDKDRSEPGDGIEIDADWRTGDGYALELGLRGGIAGFGIYHVSSDQYDRVVGSSADLSGTFAEVRLYGDFPLGDLEGTASMALGAGYAGVYYDDRDWDSQGTAIDARGTVGLRLGGHLGFELGLGHLAWGSPGETVGRGTFATAGLTWHPR